MRFGGKKGRKWRKDNTESSRSGKEDIDGMDTTLCLKGNLKSVEPHSLSMVYLSAVSERAVGQRLGKPGKRRGMTHEVQFGPTKLPLL